MLRARQRADGRTKGHTKSAHIFGRYLGAKVRKAPAKYAPSIYQTRVFDCKFWVHVDCTAAVISYGIVLWRVFGVRPQLVPAQRAATAGQPGHAGGA